MKKYTYHYSCLLISLVQFLLWLIGIINLVGINNSYNPQGESQVGTIVVIIVVLVLAQFGLAFLDKKVRKISDNGILDVLLLMLLSPIRFIFQIITIVKLHIAIANGNSKFGERGDYFGSSFTKFLYYYLFNSKNESVKTGHTRRFETKRSHNKRVKKEKQASEVIESFNKRQKDREDFIKKYRRSDSRYNVMFTPLICMDDHEYITFMILPTDPYRYADIKSLWINGVKVNTSNIRCTTKISLKPGKYNFKIEVEVEGYSGVKVYDGKSTKFSIHKYFELNDVVVGEDDVYLCFAAVFSAIWTEYRESDTGRKVKKEFTEWKKEYNFKQVSKSALERLYSKWDLAFFPIDK